MIVGVLGGGQLGRMLALAGYPLGLRFRFFDPADEACVDDLAPRIRGAYTDREAIARFAENIDVVTYEFENVELETARFLEARGVRLLPASRALEVSQDRLSEKQFLNEHGIETAPFRAVNSADDLHRAVSELGLPAVLKTRRLGYDGRGQTILRTVAEVAACAGDFDGTPSILEGFVPFGRELSVLAVRGADGAIACYPLVQNRHEDGILRVSRAPAVVSKQLQDAAEASARRVLEALDYVGVLAIEWFECDGRLIANEIAPRVHNSGHWTIEGAVTSQFENHLRAVTGLPLGSTRATGISAMVNLIGTVPPLEMMTALAGGHVHLYGKTPRPGRKLGHVTLCEDSQDALSAQLPRLLQSLVGLEYSTARGL